MGGKDVSTCLAPLVTPPASFVASGVGCAPPLDLFLWIPLQYWSKALLGSTRVSKTGGPLGETGVEVTDQKVWEAGRYNLIPI